MAKTLEKEKTLLSFQSFRTQLETHLEASNKPDLGVPLVKHTHKHVSH